MDRRTIGLLMHNWHSSMYDPIYAVGSSFFAGKTPPAEMIEAARIGLETILERTEWDETFNDTRQDDQEELRSLVDWLSE